MPAKIHLRPAVLADAAAIATLHAAVWHDTYRDLATPEALAALTEAHRLKQWQSMLAADDPQRRTTVAVMMEEIIAFAQTAPSSEPLFAGRAELKYLYVAGHQARRGIGRLLISDAADSLLRQGYRALGLGVVAGNEEAIRFYRALGGREAGRYTDPGPLWRSENLLYVWDDLTLLAQGSVG